MNGFSVEIQQKSWIFKLENRKLIFTMQIIFQTCSEFGGKVFCMTKIEQKITKIGLVRTFKNDFFKNLILQKTFPPNSEQVWKMICMVKINSPASRSIFRVFLVIFPEFGCPCEIWVDFFRNFSNLCTKNLEIYPRESLQIFVRVFY